MTLETIAIVGAGGRVGSALIPVLLQETDARIIAVSSQHAPDGSDERVQWCTVDIADKAALKGALMQVKPDTIVNCAAYTNVDACEADRHTAWAVNVTLPETLARISRILDAHLVHMSTDYVFDGAKGPYDEHAVPSPLNYYGKSKLAGENVCLSGSSAATIVRTNVVFGQTGVHPDFVQWVTTSLEQKKPIRVVTDQYSNPTFSDDVTDALRRIVLKRRTGLFHVGGADYLSRYDFAVQIAEFFKLDPTLVLPVSTAELKQAAKRPLRGGLVSLHAESVLGLTTVGITAALSSWRHRVFSTAPSATL